MWKWLKRYILGTHRPWGNDHFTHSSAYAFDVPESHAIEQKHCGEVVKSSLVKSHNCNERVLFGEAASGFSFLCVCLHAKQQATAGKLLPHKRALAGQSLQSGRWHHHCETLTRVIFMSQRWNGDEKGFRTGEKSSEWAETGSKREGKNSEEGL